MPSEKPVISQCVMSAGGSALSTACAATTGLDQLANIY